MRSFDMTRAIDYSGTPSTLAKSLTYWILANVPGEYPPHGYERRSGLLFNLEDNRVGMATLSSDIIVVGK